jgi:hypothetical protein
MSCQLQSQRTLTVYKKLDNPHHLFYCFTKWHTTHSLAPRFHLYRRTPHRRTLLRRHHHTTSQADAYDEGAVGDRLLQLAQQAPVMAGGAAAALRISLVLAAEHLAAAEAAGLLCRDDTLEGLRFYPNMFPQFAEVR